MRAVDLNFASTPFRNNTPYYLGYGLGAVLLVVFTCYNGYAFVHYSKSEAALESDHTKKQARLAELYADAGRIQREIGSKDLKGLNERAAFTNGLLLRRRFSWTGLLNSLEEVQPYQVRLLSLRPIVLQRGILIEARAVAKDLQAFWNFQQNLQNHQKFRRVYPAGYLKSSELGDYVFNISFNYFPDGVPAGVEGISPAALAREGIVQAPGSDEYEGGNGAAEEEEEITEPPPRAESPRPSAAPRAGSSSGGPTGGGERHAGPGSGDRTMPQDDAATADRSARTPSRGQEAATGSRAAAVAPETTISVPVPPPHTSSMVVPPRGTVRTPPKKTDKSPVPTVRVDETGDADGTEKEEP